MNVHRENSWHLPSQTKISLCPHPSSRPSPGEMTSHTVMSSVKIFSDQCPNQSPIACELGFTCCMLWQAIDRDTIDFSLFVRQAGGGVGREGGRAGRVGSSAGGGGEKEGRMREEGQSRPRPWKHRDLSQQKMTTSVFTFSQVLMAPWPLNYPKQEAQQPNCATNPTKQNPLTMWKQGTKLLGSCVIRS